MCEENSSEALYKRERKQDLLKPCIQDFSACVTETWSVCKTLQSHGAGCSLIAYRQNWADTDGEIRTCCCTKWFFRARCAPSAPAQPHMEQMVISYCFPLPSLATGVQVASPDTQTWCWVLPTPLQPLLCAWPCAGLENTVAKLRGQVTAVLTELSLGV